MQHLRWCLDHPKSASTSENAFVHWQNKVYCTYTYTPARHFRQTKKCVNLHKNIKLANECKNCVEFAFAFHLNWCVRLNVASVVKFECVYFISSTSYAISVICLANIATYGDNRLFLFSITWDQVEHLHWYAFLCLALFIFVNDVNAAWIVHCIKS